MEGSELGGLGQPAEAVPDSRMIEALAEAISAVGGADFHRDFIRLLADTTGFKNVVLLAFFRSGWPKPIFSSYGPEDEERILAPYLASAYLLDPMYNMILDGVPDGVYKLSDHCPDEFEKTEYYKKYYSYLGLKHEICLFIKLSEEVCLGLSLGAFGAEKICPTFIAATQSLFPCIQALCRKHYSYLVLERTVEQGSLEDICRRLGLSGREIEVTTLLLRGYSNKLIARQLDISPETVKVYRKRINKKLGTSSTYEIFANFFPRTGRDDWQERDVAAR